MSEDPKPDELKSERVQLLMTPSEVKAIDDWGFASRIRTRAEAMRRLCQMALGFDEKIGLTIGKSHEAADKTMAAFRSLREVIKKQPLQGPEDAAERIVAIEEIRDALKALESLEEDLVDLLMLAHFYRSQKIGDVPGLKEAKNYTGAFKSAAADLLHQEKAQLEKLRREAEMPERDM
jgi:hypothetical protein